MDTTTQLTDYSDDSMFNNDQKLTQIPYIGKNLELIEQQESNCDSIVKWASRIELESITMKEVIGKVVETTKSANTDILDKCVSKLDKNIDLLKSMIDGVKTQDGTTFAATYTVLQETKSNIKSIKDAIDVLNKTQSECTKVIGSLFNAFQNGEKLRAREHLVIKDEIGEVKQYLSLLLPLVDKIQKSSDQVPEVAQQPEQPAPNQDERVNGKGERLDLRISRVWTWFVQDAVDPDLAHCGYCNEVVQTNFGQRARKLSQHLKSHNLTKLSINQSRKNQHQTPDVPLEQWKQPKLQPNSIDAAPVFVNQDATVNGKGRRPRTSWVWTWFAQDPIDPDLAHCDYCSVVIRTILGCRTAYLSAHLKSHNLTNLSLNQSRSNHHQAPEVTLPPEIVQPTSSPPTKCNQDARANGKGERVDLRTSWVWSWFVQDPTNLNLAHCDYCDKVVKSKVNCRTLYLSRHLETHNLNKRSINQSRQIPSNGFGMKNPSEEKLHVSSAKSKKTLHPAPHQNLRSIVSQYASPTEHYFSVPQLCENVDLKRNVLMQEKISGTNPAATGLAKSKKRRIL